MSAPGDPVPVIAVDGPGGTGKGTVCGWLATALGWHLLDSGALYRATAMAATGAGIDLADERRVAGAAAGLAIAFAPGGGGDDGILVLLDGRDVTADLRTEACGAAASRVAALPAVRAALLGRQRRERRLPGLVADGRDMGTVVFPDALLKVFLTASAEERARRRYNQLKQKGLDVNLAALFQDIADRDRRDRDRSVAPMLPAFDAVVIDTTGHSIRDVLAEVTTHVRARGLEIDDRGGPRNRAGKP